MPVLSSIGAGLAIGGLIMNERNARKARHFQRAQASETLVAQKEMTDKIIAAEAELNKPMPQVDDAKRKQAATRLIASKYSGRGRQSTVMSDVLG